MVEDRITDGKRIAQLLASEVTGLSSPPLDRYEVVDADPDAEPTAGGTFAYALAVDERRVAEVFVRERSARIDLSVDAGVPPEAETLTGDGLGVATTDDGRLRVDVEYGAAVKRAVDLLVAALDE